jgi:hypothetical protein
MSLSPGQCALLPADLCWRGHSCGHEPGHHHFWPMKMTQSTLHLWIVVTKHLILDSCTTLRVQRWEPVEEETGPQELMCPEHCLLTKSDVWGRQCWDPWQLSHNEASLLPRTYKGEMFGETSAHVKAPQRTEAKPMKLQEPKEMSAQDSVTSSSGDSRRFWLDVAGTEQSKRTNNIKTEPVGEKPANSLVPKFFYSILLPAMNISV